ncbi:MAG: hypothetical protein WDA70_01215 [Lysobacteraceae bacterium]
MKRPISPSRRDELLAIHGADPAHWPADARALLAECDPHQLAAEAQLDDWLASSSAPPAPAALRAAILMQAAAAARAAPPLPRNNLRDALLWLWQELGGARLAAPAFALALVAGLTLGGGLSPLLHQPEASVEDVLSLAQIDERYLALNP